MITVQLIIIILLFLITFVNKIITKHYFLFNWYCKNYFNLKKRLTQNELKYIFNIFNHSPIELLNKTMDNKRLSFITYSHIISKNNKTNIQSGRFSIGSILFPDLAFTYALDILKERSIILPKFLLTKKYKFGGLGWDFNKDYFKIYFRCLHRNFLNTHKDIIQNINDKRIERILKEYKTKKYWKEGILSFTYKNNKLIERKIYVYPKYMKNKYVTYMLSDKRGLIKQTDIHKYEGKNLYEKELINSYEKINIKLDTISKDKDSTIFYFPK